jgi:hypothetical protein
MRRWLAGLGSIMVAALLVPAAAAGGAPSAGAAPNPAHCDPIDTAQCLLPFPDNFFTVADATKATGLRVNFPVDVMPTNAAGTPIDPTDWNRLDGFSPGSEIIVQVPGIDLARTGVAPITNIGQSLQANAPVVLLDMNTGRRVPYWGELDTWNSDAATRALVIRPARNFLEGHRIAVGLRNLKDASGHRLPTPQSFRIVRDRKHPSDPALAARKPDIDQVVAALKANGVKKQSLYLAWDFTVGSAQGIAGGMLHMRDDAYAALGSGVPAVTITKVETQVSSTVLRRITGTFSVPQYLTGTGSPGSRLVLGPDGLPQRNGTYQAAFSCIIPRAVQDAQGNVHPARGIVYGHGLLGSVSEINGFGDFANQFDTVICATPFIGMASDDVPNVLNVLSNLSTFGSIPDRLQQSLLDFQFLARLLKDPRGFGSNFVFLAGPNAAHLQSVITPNEVFYNGNSQGGILGGAATAISQEWTRAVLGVPGMNYSTLLPRSVDFDPFFTLLQSAYPDARTYTLSVALIQMLWDRGDADGYAQHITSNPYENTPAHQVLMIEAFGDHQVANIGTETEARTIGAFVHQPAVAPGRSNDLTPFWDIPAVPSSPFNGSVLELWDFGTPAPPIQSLPPEPPTYGNDPHGFARSVFAVQDQASQFLEPNGAFVNECGAAPCAAPEP